MFRTDENIHEGWNYHTWDDASKPAYTVYRFYGNETGSCDIGEIKFKGVKTITNNDPTYACDAKVVVDDVETALPNQVTYSGSLTPKLDSINPRYGTVTGGTSVTFTGTDFSSNIADYTILLDMIPCVATAATSTSVTCDTGSRPGLHNATTTIFIAGKGDVANNDLVYKYASAWSDPTTWGGLYAPVDGESVFIPSGLNLLVDIDASPILKAVVVEGGLIFQPDTADPTHHRTFDAYYIFVRNGFMEVGTAEHVYSSKITITMHGTVADPYIPIYGNKVIGVRNGVLDMHGPVR